MTEYGAKGCRCWAEPKASDPTDVHWMPNASCPYHGILADFERGRRDTGVYAVVPVGYRPRNLSTPPDGPE
ncbi:MAG TPA: hypothetical protein VD864_03095, partial [Nocardioides sp.]|nr:hypothetical protein [Nocardioides sp.]